MRLDKFLKVSRLIKRREVAKEFIQKGYVFLNDKQAKPASEVEINDIIKITSPVGRVIQVKIKEIKTVSKVSEVSSMYEVIDGTSQEKV